MATLGKRDVKEKNPMTPSDRDRNPAPIAGVNLIIHSAIIQPVAAESVIAPTIGTPIMREDFVTDTGFMIGAG